MLTKTPFGTRMYSVERGLSIIRMLGHGQAESFGGRILGKYELHNCITQATGIVIANELIEI